MTKNNKIYSFYQKTGFCSIKIERVKTFYVLLK